VKWKVKARDLEPKSDPIGGVAVSSSESDPPTTTRDPTPYPPYRWEPPEKQGFFHMQLRDVLYAASLIIVGLLFVFQRQSEVRELSINVNNVSKVVDQLVVTTVAQQKILDEHTSDIRLNAERNLEQDKRIAEAQQQLVTLVPDMREIKTKLNFVADMLDRQQKAGR
jgi:hypothetical protein